MTCNFANHLNELTEAFESVSNSASGEEWAIFGYEGNSNIVKVDQQGTGGIQELAANLNSGKIQYGFSAVKSPGSTQMKVVLIHWQGEGVPTVRRANTMSHIEEVKRFIKRVHLTIYARSDEDLDSDALSKHLASLSVSAPEKPSSAAVFAAYEPQEPVRSVYTPAKPQQDIDLQEREKFWKQIQAEDEQKRQEEIRKKLSSAQKKPVSPVASVATYEPPQPVKSVWTPAKPQQDIDVNEREKFWREMQAEEDARRREEAQKIEERNQQMIAERKMLEKQIHEARLAGETAKSPISTNNQLDYKAYAQQSKKSNLITGRTQMFEQKVAELTASQSKPLKKPKNFKHEIKISKPVGTPVNREENQENHTNSIPKTMDRDKPVFAKIATPSVYEAEPNDFHRTYPPFSGVKLPPMNLSPPPAPMVKMPEPVKTPETVKSPQNEFPVLEKSTAQFDQPPPSWPVSTPPELPKTLPPSLPQYELPPVENEAPKYNPSQYDFPPEQTENISHNGINGHKGDGETIRAVALWDYQAEEDTEITFNPDDIITDVEMIHEGWWKGKGPDGSIGLFPSNYVKLI